METCAKCGHTIHSSKELHYWLDAALCTACHDCVQGTHSAPKSQHSLMTSLRKVFSWKPAPVARPSFSMGKKAAA